MTVRTVHVEHCMGTVFTIDLRGPGDWTDAVAEVVGWLHRVDAVFSTYRADSDISRIRRGELRVADADPDVAVVLELCARLRLATDGYFSAMSQGKVDPTGLVKGWAVERAGQLLRARGCANHAVNGGGDLQLAGESAPGRPWRVGIADPHGPATVLSVVTGRDFAVATSGTAERGQHIVDPFTGRPATALSSASVVGPSLTEADAYATAAFVMGAQALPWIAKLPDYQAMLVDEQGLVTAGAGWRLLSAEPLRDALSA